MVVVMVKYLLLLPLGSLIFVDPIVTNLTLSLRPGRLRFQVQVVMDFNSIKMTREGEGVVISFLFFL